MKPLNVVDSCGWLEYFAGGKHAAFYAPAIEDAERLLVPTICILEVFRKIVRERGERLAIRYGAAMRQGRVIALDANIALMAARLGVETNLPLADSVVLATARIHQALTWTHDSDFRKIDGVKFPP